MWPAVRRAVAAAARGRSPAPLGAVRPAEATEWRSTGAASTSLPAPEGGPPGLWRADSLLPHAYGGLTGFAAGPWAAQQRRGLAGPALAAEPAVAASAAPAAARPPRDPRPLADRPTVRLERIIHAAAAQPPTLQELWPPAQAAGIKSRRHMKSLLRWMVEQKRVSVQAVAREGHAGARKRFVFRLAGRAANGHVGPKQAERLGVEPTQKKSPPAAPAAEET